MKRLESTLPNMLLSLTLVAACSGALLGWVYDVTKEPIAIQAAEAQLNAIREVAPAFDNNPEADADTISVQGSNAIVYPAKKKGKLVGAAVKTSTMTGFAGEVIVMCGFNADGSIRDYRVLQQAETPGLGSKMEDWFRNPTAARSIIGKNPAKVRMNVSKDGGDIDGITAATVSSRAFLSTIRTAYAAWCELKGEPAPPVADANSGASTQKSTKEESDAHSGASTQKQPTTATQQTIGQREAASGSSSASADSSDAKSGATPQKH